MLEFSCGLQNRSEVADFRRLTEENQQEWRVSADIASKLPPTVKGQYAYGAGDLLERGLPANQSMR
ncbi:hypothetical protein AUC61_07590 [Pseudomonas sp. S25]|uniref:Uncharacterized protein n=1 Tax=Pseudomonas maioricensis TaxID=1766623 RepID=A0ABS9ZFK0_9PSED|nr:hypothetical protein [Pseudomonas sp. S25]